jgi:hypothetical protein
MTAVFEAGRRSEGGAGICNRVADRNASLLGLSRRVIQASGGFKRPTCASNHAGLVFPTLRFPRFDGSSATTAPSAALPRRPLYGARTPRRQQRASRPFAGHRLHESPFSGSGPTWSPRTPNGSLAPESTGTPHARAKSTRGRTRQHSTSETRDRVGPGVACHVIDSGIPPAKGTSADTARGGCPLPGYVT